jgi:hypothetical protein
MLLVSRQTLLGTGFNTVGLREAFHGLGVQDVAEFNTGCCSVFCFLKEKFLKREKLPGGFFPRTDTSCWLCHASIFLPVRCNYEAILRVSP